MPMKIKSFLLVILFLGGVSLLSAGCQLEQQAEKVGSLATEGSDADTALSEPTRVQTYQVGDIISMDNTLLIVLGWDQPPGGDFNPPEEGKKYVAVDVMIANQGERSFSVSPLLQMTLKDSQGRKYNLNGKANTASGANPPRGEINPGERIRGKIGYQIPEDAAGLVFVYEQKIIGLGEVSVDLGTLPVSIDPPEDLALDRTHPVYQVGDAVEISDLSIQVLRVTQPEGTQLVKPEAGYQFIVVEVTVLNQGDTTREIAGGLQMYLKDGSGQQYTMHLGAQAAADSAVPDDELQPGKKVRGQIGFQVPEGAENLEFIFDAELIGYGKVFFNIP